MPRKKPRESRSKILVNALVNAWKENINLIEFTHCNEGWGKVKDVVAKHEQGKTFLKDTYKKAKDKNNKSVAFPNFHQFYNDFSEMLETKNLDEVNFKSYDLANK